MIAKEGSKWGEFCGLWANNPIVSFNLIASGLYWYGYNELATMTIKKVSDGEDECTRACTRCLPP